MKRSKPPKKKADRALPQPEPEVSVPAGRTAPSLSDVINEISAVISAPLPVRERTGRIKKLMSEALVSETFRLDCLEAALADQRVQRGVIHLDPASRFSLCLFYWAPRYYSPPHEHRNWTVTGVVHGTLEVRLHDRQPNGELPVKRSVTSAVGAVGALVPPCIHTVGNPGDGPAASLHVFGPTENKPDAVWLGDVKVAAPPAWRPLKLWTTVECAAAHPSAQAGDILERVFAAGSVDMRRLALDRLARFQPERAQSLDQRWQEQLADRADAPAGWPGWPPDSVWSRAARIETNRRAGAEPSSPYAQRVVARAAEFPMTEVIERYRRDFDVAPDVALLHEREIKRYLALAALFPDQPLGMAGKVDDLWHTFIIFTREYQRFCWSVCGHYIHHRPTPATEPKELSRASYQFFHDVYGRVFGEPPPTEVWPSIAMPCSGGPSGGDPLCGCSPCSPVPCNNRPPECESPTGEPVCESPTDDPICECPPA
jgi:predicted metal-dependent enzyme (double-stranded beta helix superfamily)